MFHIKLLVNKLNLEPRISDNSVMKVTLTESGESLTGNSIGAKNSKLR